MAGCLLKIQSAQQIQRQQGGDGGGDVERTERSQQQHQICGDCQLDGGTGSDRIQLELFAMLCFFAVSVVVHRGGVFVLVIIL